MPFGRRRRSSSYWGRAYPPAKPPRPVTDGLRAKSQRGAIGETWWSQRFIEVLEDFHEGPRLARGRAYARRGQVIDMEVEPGEVSARVQGSRARPYSVRIGVTVLGDGDWARVEEAMASQAVFLARLLAGEMPHEIGDAFATTGLSLFPATPDDLDTDCSCPDWQNPCKHIAAVYYLLAEAFDRDPFLIFAWRGRPRERLLADLRALRGHAAGTSAPGLADEAGGSGQALPAPEDALFGFIGPGESDLTGELSEEQLRRFWEPVGDLAAVHVEPRAVIMPDAILRDLGSSGLSTGGRPLEDLLAPAYRTIAATAVRIAAGETQGEAPMEPGTPAASVQRPSPAHTRAPRKPKPVRAPSREHLEELIESATVDCSNRSEECVGIFEMLTEDLEIPFVTTVLGVAVTVTALDITDDDQIVAICRRGRSQLRVALLELPMPDPPPDGADWIDAYRVWARRD